MEQQPQFAAWVQYADAGEASWHKRWLVLTHGDVRIGKSDKPGSKFLFAFPLSSIVTKKLAPSFERRHSAIVFTLMRNFIVSFTSQPEIDAALAFINRYQESTSGSIAATAAACFPCARVRHTTSGVTSLNLSVLVSGAGGGGGQTTSPFHQRQRQRPAPLPPCLTHLPLF